MPPIIKKQIKKVQKANFASGYIKLIPLLFFVGFLILGWLISSSALRIFRPEKQLSSSDGVCGISSMARIPVVFAQDAACEAGCGSDSSCAGSCGSCSCTGGDTDDTSCTDSSCASDSEGGGGGNCDCWQ